MRILIVGGAGFIGTNLALKLAENPDNEVTLVDKNIHWFSSDLNKRNMRLFENDLQPDSDFLFLKNHDIVYHLVSSNAPSSSNKNITDDINNNVIFSSNLFHHCVEFGIKKVIFISSGGTVYGANVQCPIQENSVTNPISSYGVQKLMIEKLLYLYNYVHNLDYRVIRLANPYGPYQRPNGVLGAVTTFIFKALNHEPITVYGDGSVIRDFIYIDDAIKGILNIADLDESESDRIFNLGSGKGTSLNEVLETIKTTLDIDLDITNLESRSVDIQENYLDISRYESYCGKLEQVSLSDGIAKTAEFMFKNEMIKSD